MEARISESRLNEMLARLDNWKIVEGKLHKDFKFEDFDKAVGFILQVAEIAGSLNHHPEIFNVYNKVSLDLTTHDAGGITGLDFAFAEDVDKLTASS